MKEYPIFVDIEEIKQIREKIVANARKLRGINFCHRGRTRFGLDCLGFDWLCYRRSGVEIPDGDGKIYEINWFLFAEEERYLENILRFFKWTEDGGPLRVKTRLPTFKGIKPGDIPLFRLHCNNTKITHCGIWLDDGKTFMHSFSGAFVKRDEIRQKYFFNRYAGSVTFRGFIGEQ